MGAVFNRVTLSATGDTLLAVAGTNAGDAGWQLTFAGSSWTGSVVLKQNTAPPGAAASLSSVSYFNATTGALVSAGTAISSGGSFIVANTGLDLYAVYTHTAGTVQITLMAAGGQYGGVQVAAADVTAGTFGAYSGATGTYTFPGAAVVTGALTAGAASFTTGAFSGTITSTKDGLVFVRTGTTGVQYIQLTNTSGDTAIGTSGATVGGDFFSSLGAAYETGLAFKNGKQLTIGIFAGTGIAKFDSTGFTVGASTFVVTAATGAVSAGIGTFAAATAAVLTVRSTNTSAQIIVDTLGVASVSSQVALQNNGTTKWQFGYQLVATTGEFEIYDTAATRTAVKIATGAGGLMTLTGPLAITGALTGATSVISASPTGGLGYGTGAGGAQTQLTNKQTGVTSNTITTAITLNNEALAADAITAFTFTNSSIAATDTVIVTHESAGTSGAYTCNAFPAAGSAVISVANRTAGALGEAIVLRVTVIKSVSA